MYSQRVLKSTALLSIFFFFCFTLINCHKISPESKLDSPEAHFEMGLQLIQRYEIENDVEKAQDLLKRAEHEFKRSILLTKSKKLRREYKNFGDSYAGIALVYMYKHNFDEAIKNANIAIRKDPKNVYVWVARGRIYTAEKSKNWYKKAADDFQTAIDSNGSISRENPAPYYYWGIALSENYNLKNNFILAGEKFAKVLDIGKDFSKEADIVWKKLQDIQRAAPGTITGKKVAFLDKINRGELAALFVTELNIDKIFKQELPKHYDTSFKTPEKFALSSSEVEKLKDYKDIEKHWASNFIKDVLETGGMDAFPDNTFQPNRRLTRAEFAMTVQRLIRIITHDDGLDTRYIGEVSHIKDVRSDHFAYNAIMVCIERGILSLRDDASFGLNNSVSGAEALLAIRKLKNILQAS